MGKFSRKRPLLLAFKTLEQDIYNRAASPATSW